MKTNINLSTTDIEEIKELAEKTRREFGVSDQVPLGDNLKLLIEKEGIYLCEYPFRETEGSHTDAAITVIETERESMTFIGLNTSLYFDEQLFALAHELYHYFTRTGMAYEPSKEEEASATEAKADRFAAELLLPERELQRIKVHQLSDFDFEANTAEAKARLFRVIAKIQCLWSLPYQSVVRRFYEVGYITEKKYKELYELNVRDENSDYHKILSSIDKEKCELLNRKSRSNSISDSIYDIILKNFYSGDIDECELTEALRILGRKPSDFGVDIVVDNDDDINALFDEGEIS